MIALCAVFAVAEALTALITLWLVLMGVLSILLISMLCIAYATREKPKEKPENDSKET